MTMLDILKARLPDGLTITSVKERSSKHLVQFAYKGENLSGQGELVKTCVPGKENMVCDTTIQVAMTGFMLDKGDLEGAKYWMDYAKRTSATQTKERTAGEMEKLVRDYAEACRLLKKNHSLGDVNAVTRTSRELLRAILDQYGYSDVEVID